MVESEKISDEEAVWLSKDIARRIALLTSLVPDAGVVDVEDPYSGTAADYAVAFSLIGRAVDALALSLSSDSNA